MDRGGVDRLSCVVCGIATKRHAGWFLVTDNYWLDRVKVLSWHPVVAGQTGMQSVCGKEHLKILLTHWLNHANLQLTLNRSTTSDERNGHAMHPGAARNTAISAGRVLGELAVERDPRSPIWTGSPEAMECILNALIGETEVRSRGLEVTTLERLVGYSYDYAYR